MKKVEGIMYVLLVIAIILRVLLVPGSATFVVMILLSLTFLYFYFGFAFFNDIRLRNIFKKSSYNTIPNFHLAGGIATGFAVSIACIAILFKLQSWPGSSAELIFGIVSCSIILIISLIKNRGKHAEYYQRIVLRVAVLGSACLLLFITPSKTFLELMQRDNPGYVNAVEKAWADPKNKQLWDKVNEEQRKMNHH